MTYRACQMRYVDGQAREVEVFKFDSKEERDGFVKGANRMMDDVTYYVPDVAAVSVRLVMFALED